MTIDINIQSDDLIEALRESNELSDWLVNMIEEHSPGIDLQDELIQGSFRIPEGTFHGEGVLDQDGVGSAIERLLGTLPGVSEDRCSLGRAFERAVMLVLLNVLRGEEMQSADGSIYDDELRAAFARLGAPVPGARVVCANTLPDEEAAELDDAERQADADDGRPVTEQPGREVLVVPMSGDRSNRGTVTVRIFNEGSGESYKVYRDGVVIEETASKFIAFTEAFARTGWGSVTAAQSGTFEDVVLALRELHDSVAQYGIGTDSTGACMRYGNAIRRAEGVLRTHEF